MNGLMTRMQESADQNLGSVRTQLTMVGFSDLSRESREAFAGYDVPAAENVARRAQDSANPGGKSNWRMVRSHRKAP